MSGETTEAVPVSAWSWMLHPVFPRCLGEVEGRYDLSRPFVIQEYVYATDGRIAVRMPVPEGWAIPNPENAPPSHLALDLFGRDDWSRSPWRPEPTQFPPVEGACETCKGEKLLGEVPCPWCNEYSINTYEAPFCDECYALEGKIPAGPCYECWGTGIHDALGRIEVAPGYGLQRRYVALLHEFEMTTYLPAAEWPVTLEAWGKMGGKLITRFTLGDIVGVLMPMTPPKEDRR